MKLSQSFRNRYAGLEQAKEKLLNDIKEDINIRMETRKAKLEEISAGAGVHYSLLSAIRNGRRPPTKDFIRKYTKYLEEIGE